MPIKTRVDEIDAKIVNLISKNASITNAAISKEVGLSEGPTLMRVRKLRKEGYIKDNNMPSFKKWVILYSFYAIILIKDDKLEDLIKELTEEDRCTNLVEADTQQNAFGLLATVPNHTTVLATLNFKNEESYTTYMSKLTSKYIAHGFNAQTVIPMKEHFTARRIKVSL